MVFNPCPCVTFVHICHWACLYQEICATSFTNMYGVFDPHLSITFVLVVIGMLASRYKPTLFTNTLSLLLILLVKCYIFQSTCFLCKGVNLTNSGSGLVMLLLAVLATYSSIMSSLILGRDSNQILIDNFMYIWLHFHMCREYMTLRRLKLLMSCDPLFFNLLQTTMGRNALVFNLCIGKFECSYCQHVGKQRTYKKAIPFEDV